MAKKKKGSREPQTMPLPLSSMLEKWMPAFAEKTGDPSKARLTALWANWENVLGEWAQGALPLGHRKDVLLVGGEDSMLLQELSYAAPEILECVNTFLAQDQTGSDFAPFFHKVEFHLLLGKKPLDTPWERPKISPIVMEKPHDIGGLIDVMPQDSPLRKAYEAYVKLFESNNG